MSTPYTPADPHPRTRDVLHHALAAAAQGWHVFPLIPDSKRPAVPRHRAADCQGTDPICAAAGRHQGWEERATTDPDRITRYWSARPWDGVAIACGPSHLVVIDCDTNPNTNTSPGTSSGTSSGSGWDNLRRLAALADADTRDPHWARTWTITTPSGGRHLYYRSPEGLELGNTASRLAPRVDTRGAGGYVATLGTPRYQIALKRPPRPLPTFLANSLTPTPRDRHRATQGLPAPVNLESRTRHERWIRAAIAGETRRIRNARPGTRNQALFHASVALGQLVGGGHLTQPTAETILRDAATGHIHHRAYTPGEAMATISSGLNRGISEPRTWTEAV